MSTINSKPADRSTPISLAKVLLHLEGLALFGVAVAVYAQQGFSWWMFALLLLAPDLAMLGYLISVPTGSVVYNLLHTYALPLALAAIGYGAGWLLGLQLALIWLAHIGMDRSVGYGLKYPTHFKDTHLARV